MLLKFAYHTNKDSYNKSSRQARIRWLWHLWCPEACRFSTPVAALKKLSWTSGLVHTEAYFFIDIKGEPGQNRCDTYFLIEWHASWTKNKLRSFAVKSGNIHIQ